MRAGFIPYKAKKVPYFKILFLFNYHFKTLARGLSDGAKRPLREVDDPEAGLLTAAPPT